MPELTREEKLKLIEKLPQRLQEFMYSEDTGAALLFLGQKYNLTDERVHLLSKLTGDIVLGIVPIASLAQEINSNILPNPQMAMQLAQKLYADILAPALAPPVAPLAPPASTPAPMAPRPAAPPVASRVEPPMVSSDRYREPTTPEVVDLRKLPPAASRVEPPAATVPVAPKIVSPPRSVAPPAFVFPKPIQRPPLIEAEPHRAPAVNKPMPPAVNKIEPPLSRMPQVILRSPGLPPIDSSRDILDLRKDKGEF